MRQKRDMEMEIEREDRKGIESDRTRKAQREMVQERDRGIWNKNGMERDGTRKGWRERAKKSGGGERVTSKEREREKYRKQKL